MREPYWMADDCPNCGEKDQVDQWLGARMCDSSWGHNYMCCSDKCGREFANSPKRRKMERAEIKRKINALKYQLRDCQ